jgi:hypothetical protein
MKKTGKLKKSIHKDNLKSLNDYSSNDFKTLIESAIKDKIIFYIINKNGEPFPIEAGDAERIKNNHPKKVYLNHQNKFELDLDSGPKETHGWQSIWIDVNIANKILNIPDSSTPNQNKIKKYSTPLLEIQEKAIEKFWLNHEPTNPPKSEAIIKWLIAEHTIARRMAEAIDSIIRPLKFKLGGNRRQ